MKINNVQNVSFGSLKIGYTVQKKLANKNLSKNFKKELTDFKSLIRANGWHKQKYVDIILGTEKDFKSDKDVFFGVISSKNQGTPNCPDYKCYLGKDKRSVLLFDKWVKGWNENYSPAVQKEWQEIRERLKRYFDTAL